MAIIPSLCGVEIDYYDNADFWKAPEVTRLVKEGVLLSEEKLSALPDSAFAVKICGNQKIKRAFPIYNKTATLFSAAWLKKYGSDLPYPVASEAEKRLNEVLNSDGLGIQIEVSKCGEFPLDQNYFNHHADNLVGSFAKLPWIDRVQHCTSFVKAAGMCNCTIENEDILSYVAKPKYGNLLEEGLYQRERFVNASENEYSNEVWDRIKTHLLKSANDTSHAVSILALFDSMAGIDSEYDKSIMDPAKTIFGIKTGERVFLGLDDDAEIKRREILEVASTLSPENFKDDKDAYYIFISDPLRAYDKGTDSFKRRIKSLIKKLRANRGKESVE